MGGCSPLAKHCSTEISSRQGSLIVLVYWLDEALLALLVLAALAVEVLLRLPAQKLWLFNKQSFW